MSAAMMAPKKFKFQVLTSAHVGDDPDNPVMVLDPRTGQQVKLRNGDRRYERGDVIETDEDLSRFNVPGYDPKFSKLDEADGVQKLPRESSSAYVARMNELARTANERFLEFFKQMNVDAMSLEQLREVAEREGWDLDKLKPQERDNRDAVHKLVKAEIQNVLKSFAKAA